MRRTRPRVCELNHRIVKELSSRVRMRAETSTRLPLARAGFRIRTRDLGFG